MNTPQTSSTGRLFDGVASLLCVRHIISHESQAAMELEAVAQKILPGKGYDFELSTDSGEQGKAGESGFEINLMPCIRQIVQDIKACVSSSVISAQFHQTLVHAFVAATARVSRQTKIKKVVLSGGVFNNDIIFCTMIHALEQNGLTVYTHSKVPTGDGGISFGQAIAGAAMKGKLS